MERASDPVALFSLDEVHREIDQRWFVWTAAGLAVHPITRTDGHDATATLHLRITRHGAAAEINVSTDGSTTIAVQRPGAASATHTTVQITSLDAFGPLLDRVVELITWSGVPKDPAAPSSVAPTGGSDWVAGYDGVPYQNDALNEGGG